MVRHFGDAAMLTALETMVGAPALMHRIDEVTQVGAHHALLTVAVPDRSRAYGLRLPLPESGELQPWLYVWPLDAADSVRMLGIFLDEEFGTGAAEWAARTEDAGLILFELAPYGLRRADESEHRRMLAVAGPLGWHGDIWNDLDESHIVGFGADFGADWPLWAGGFPVDPHDVTFSPELSEALRTWSRQFEQYFDYMNHEFDPGFDEEAHNRQGDELAECVATELGNRFAVLRRTLLRSDAPPTFPAAAEALEHWLAEINAAETASHEATGPGTIAANVAVMFPEADGPGAARPDSPADEGPNAAGTGR